MAEAYVQLMRKKYPNEKFVTEINSLRRKMEDDDNVLSVKRPKVSREDHSLRCHVCGKIYKLRNSYNRHVLSHTRRFECEHCGKTYNRKYTLTEHCKRKHGMCGGESKTVNEPVTTVANETNQQEYIQRPVELPKQNSNIQIVSDNESMELPAEDTISAFKGNVVTKRFIPEGMDQYDLLKFFSALKEVVKAYIISFGVDKRGVRYFLNTRVEMFREKGDGTFETSSPYFRSKSHTYFTHDEFSDHDLNEAYLKMYAAFEEYVKRGSSWDLKKVLYLDLTCATYDPLRGSSYIKEPQTLRRSRSLVNVKNSDDKCFMYSVLAHLHPAAHNACRVQHYLEYDTELDFTNIPFPVPIAKISLFEKMNGIAINVFGFEDGEIFPIRITKLFGVRTHVNLLYLKKGEKSHYVLIKNLNKFLHRTVGYNCGERFFCPYCLQGFTKKSLQVNHTTICKTYEAQRVEYPVEGVDDILQFENFHRQLRCPFVIYADFETLNKNISNDQRNTDGLKKTAKLEPCAFGYQVVSTCSKYTKPPVIYKGEDASKRFIECMLKEQENIEEILRQPEPMTMTATDIETFQNSTHCHICRVKFNSTITRCRDHDHLSGKFRGAACQACNLNFQYPDFIPIFFHGLSNFDGSILCQSIGKFKKEAITVIPRNSEKYISFSLGKLRFLDSYRFLSCSLEQLVKNMKEDGEDDFKNFNEEFKTKEERELLLRKGVFPYDYLDNVEKFYEKQLPPKSAFFNKLTSEHITEEDYLHALKVWDTLKLENFGQYLETYLKTDVLLLSDVMEKFRDMCQSYYGNLDPAHYYTAPNLAWDACLKMTKVQLQLLTDSDMHLFFEKSVRGGVAMVSKRYCKANHPGLGDEYNPNEPNNHILYLDANNLYGWSMSQLLPTGNFRWLNKNELHQLNIQNLPLDGKKGYMMEVTLDYDSSLHDMHNDFPLAPEKKIVRNDELSPYSRELYKKLNPSRFHGTGNNVKLANRTKVEKLIPTLSSKENYVLHYRTLQLYLQLGLKLRQIHRVLEFDQEPWLKSYIDFNTNQRKNAKNDFEKDFFKLMNNAVFGKTMENLRLRQDVKLVHTKKRFKKLVAKSSFDTCKIFNEDLAAVCLKKQTVKMIRPIYTGAIILDLSKTLMYDFYYNFLKKQYGKNVSLIYTDTDSFILNIETNDVYQDMMQHSDVYDTSNYPKNHPLYSTANAKVLGKMKDEAEGKFISEVVALRPKMYSYVIDTAEIKRAKGVSKAVVKNEIRHSHYKNCLFGNSKTTCVMNLIRSELHKLYTIELSKVGLSAFEDKRYILENGIDSYAYGHYRIQSH